MSVFTDALKSIKQIPQNVGDYFDPNKAKLDYSSKPLFNQNFWNSAAAKNLSDIQTSIAKYSEMPKPDYTSRINTGNQYKDMIAKFIPSVIENIQDAPRKIANSTKNIGLDIRTKEKDKKVLAAHLAEGLEGIFDISIFEPVEKQLGKKLLEVGTKKLLTQTPIKLIGEKILKNLAKPAVTGAKYMGIYGTLKALQEGKDIKDDKEYRNFIQNEAERNAKIGVIAGPIIHNTVGGIANVISKQKAFTEKLKNATPEERAKMTDTFESRGNIDKLTDKQLKERYKKTGKTEIEAMLENQQKQQSNIISKVPEDKLIIEKLKNPSKENIDYIRNVVTGLSRVSPLKFDMEKSVGSMANYVESIGKDIIQNTLNKYNKLPSFPLKAFYAELENIKKNKIILNKNDYIDNLINRENPQQPVANAGLYDTFKVQDANQEKLIHSVWNEQSLSVPNNPFGTSLRHTLEGTGDVFRETTKGKNADTGYIAEKITRLDNFIKGKANQIDYQADAQNLKKLREQWVKQPVNTPEEQLAKDLNLAVIDGDFVKAKDIVKQIQSPVAQPTTQNAVEVKTGLENTKNVQVNDTSTDTDRLKNYNDQQDSYTQDIFILRDSMLNKGYTLEELSQFIEGKKTLPDNIKEDIQIYKNLADEFRDLTGVEMGNIPNYMRHSQQGELDLYKIGDTVFDTANAELGFSKPRTGKMTDYVLDPFFQLNKNKDEALYFVHKETIESIRQNVPESVIRKKINIANDINLAKEKPFVESKIESNIPIDTSKTIDPSIKTPIIQIKEKKSPTLNLVNDFYDLGRLQNKPLNIIKKGYTQLVQNMHDYIYKFKEIGIYQISGLAKINRASSDAGTYYQTYIKSLVDRLGKKITKTEVIGIHSKIKSFLQAQDIKINYISFDKTLKESSPAEIENLVINYLEKEYFKKGMSTFEEYLQTHKFINPIVQDDLNQLAIRLFTKDNIYKSFAVKSLEVLRKSTTLASLGYNILSAVNNLFEPKRLFGLIPVKDYPKFIINYFETFFNPTKSKNILQRYGQKSRRTSKYLLDSENISNNLDEKNLLNAIQENSKIMYLFDKSESIKDSIFLQTFEEQGLKTKLKGEALQNYVLDRFEIYGQKFGLFGEIGAFRNEWIKTSFQFAQYEAKELGLQSQILKKAFDVKSKNQNQAIKYLVATNIANIIQYTIMSKIAGVSLLSTFTGASRIIDYIFDGKIGSAPIVSLVRAIYDEFSENNKEENINYVNNINKIDYRNTRKILANTFIPAGNQLINKTGIQNLFSSPENSFFPDSFGSDKIRGFNPTVSGNVRFTTPTNTISNLLGYAFGPYSTKEARDYFNKDEKSLGKDQTDKFKNTYANSSADAIDYRNSIIQNRESENQKEKDIITFLKDPKVEIKTNSDYIKDNVIVPNTSMTINQLLQEEEQKKEQETLIKNVRLGKGDYLGYKDNKTKQDNFLKNQGITTKELSDFDNITTLKSLTPKNIAQIISQDKNINYTKYYNDEILTPAVAEQLARLKTIDNADDLMQKMKMTDSYFRDLALKKIDDDFIDKLAKQTISTNNQLIDLQVKKIKTANNLNLKKFKVKKLSLKIKKIKPLSFKTKKQSIKLLLKKS